MSEIILKPGTFRLATLDGEVKFDVVGEVTEIECDNCDDTPIIWGVDKSASFDMTAKICVETMFILLGLRKAIAESCGNKRVVHLMKNHKRKKVRLKNLHRAIRIIEKENNHD